MDVPPGGSAEEAAGGPGTAVTGTPTSPAVADAVTPAVADAVTLRSDDPEALKERIEKYKGLVARLKAALAEERAHRAQSDVKLAALEPFAAAFAGSLLGAASADAGGGRPSFDVVAKVALPAEACTCGAAAGAAASHAATCTAAAGGTWVCLRGRPSTPASPASTAAAAAVGTPTQWHAEAAVLAAFPSLKGELAALPSHTPPEEAAHLRHHMEEANEEMRRFRVRAEALLRQRDGELAAAREAALALRSTTILHTGAGTGTGAAASATASASSGRAGDASLSADASAEIGDLRVALHRALAESKARDVHWRDRLADARGEIQQLRGELEALKAKAATPPAADAAAATGSGSAGAPPTAEPAADAPPSSASASSAAASALAQEVSLLRLLQDQKASEFAAYRKRTAALVAQNDELVSKLTADVSDLRKQVRALKVGVTKAGLDAGAMLAASGVDDSTAVAAGGDVSAPASTTPVKQHRSDSAFGTPISTPGAPPAAESPSGTGGSARSPLADAGRWQYFRTIMMRYLSTPDSQASVRTALEPAIMAVMGLSPHEIAAVQKASGRSPGHASGAGLADTVGTVAAEASGYVSSAVTSVSSLWASWSGGGGSGTSGAS